MVSTELREVLVRNNKIIKKHIVLFFFFSGFATWRMGCCIYV